MPSFDSETQQGLKAYDLATKYASVIDPRLPAGMRAQLAQAITTLGATIPGQAAAKADAKNATVSQQQAVEVAIVLITGFRETVRYDSRATAKDRKDFGMGLRFNVNSPKSVLAAGAVVLKNAKENTQRALGFGITPEDIAKLEAALAAAKTADDAQDVKRARAPNATKERNAAAKNVVAATRKIGGIGMLAFVTNPAVFAEFQALTTAPSKRSAAPKAEAPKS